MLGSSSHVPHHQLDYVSAPSRLQNLCKDASMPSFFHPCMALGTSAESQSSTVEMEDCVLETMGGSANFIVRLNADPSYLAPEIVDALSC
jgi:hypothetical protein